MADEFNIDDIVGKEATDISDEEKTFLEGNKEQLTTDELTKFGFTVEPIKPVTRNQESEKQTVEPPAKTETPSDDDDDDKDEEKRVSSIVNKALEPERQRTRELQNTVEVTTFISANPDFAKYKDSIIEHVKNPAYANIPIDRIAKMVAADDLMKIGARRERAAQTKVNETKNPSNGARDTGGKNGPNWLTASKEDFEAKKREIMGQRT